MAELTGDSSGTRRSERIVIFCAMLSPYTNALYNQLIGMGLQVSVLCCTEQEPNRSWARSFTPNYDNRVLRGVHIRLGSSRFAHFNLGIARALRAMKPDLLIISGFFPSMAIAACWAVLTGTRLGLTCDGWRHTMPMSLYHRIVRPWILRHCATVITCSEKGRRYFVEEGVPAERVYKVPLNPAWGAPSRLPSFAERPFDVLWCGHLTDDVKNAGFFLRVCVELKRRVPSLRVRLVGTGQEEAAVLGGLAAAGIEHEHDRYVPWNKIAEVYLESKMLLFPSRWEAWGLVCNEALQCGVPCIVSPHVGAGGDLVLNGETGYVLPLDVKIWADTAESFLVDRRLWEACSVRGTRRAGENSVANSAAAFCSAVAGSREMEVVAQQSDPQRSPL